jgi:hypothetical protein
MDEFLLRGDGRQCVSRDDQALHHGVPGEVRRAGRFHPAPWNGAGLPAPQLKKSRTSTCGNYQGIRGRNNDHYLASERIMLNEEAY